MEERKVHKYKTTVGDMVICECGASPHKKFTDDWDKVTCKNCLRIKNVIKRGYREPVIHHHTLGSNLTACNRIIYQKWNGDNNINVTTKWPEVNCRNCQRQYERIMRIKKQNDEKI